MVKCFGILEVDRGDLSVQEIPVLIELSKEHIDAIKKAVDFINQTPSVINVSVGLCLSLPKPNFMVVDVDKNFRKSYEEYTYLYARVFRDSIGLGVTYVTSTSDFTFEESYFGYNNTELFFKEAEKGFVVFGDYIEHRLYDDDDFVRDILECLGKDTLEQIAGVLEVSMEDLPLPEEGVK